MKTNEVSQDESDRLSGKPSVDLADSYQILRGYLLQISSLKEMNGNVSCSQLPEVKSLLPSERGSTGPYLAQHQYLQNCNVQNQLLSFHTLCKTLNKQVFIRNPILGVFQIQKNLPGMVM